MSDIEKQGITEADLLKVIIDLNRTPDMITLNKYSDIRFYPKNRILLFRRMNDPLSNQSCIMNRAVLLGIGYKTHSCELVPPYDKIILTKSRIQFLRIKAMLLE